MHFNKIPPHKVRLCKKVFYYEQDLDCVTLTLDDEASARGDILVGADGAHSAVRSRQYKTLAKDGLLP